MIKKSQLKALHLVRHCDDMRLDMLYLQDSWNNWKGAEPKDMQEKSDLLTKPKLAFSGLKNVGQWRIHIARVAWSLGHTTTRPRTCVAGVDSRYGSHKMTCGIAGMRSTSRDREQSPTPIRLRQDHACKSRRNPPSAIPSALHRWNYLQIPWDIGVGYEASDALYGQLQNKSNEIYMSTFRALLVEEQDIILERAFYGKKHRDMYRRMAEEAGARVLLVFLKAEDAQGKEVHWERI
jgi:hypothetical protein